MWLILAFAAPAAYAAANIFDNRLAGKAFRHPVPLIFYAVLFNILFLPLIWISSGAVWPSRELWPVLALLGFINIAYLYPYYRGLQSDDTSTAVSFFALGRILIPGLAFLIVGEVLSWQQYLGIFLIIMSSVLLGLKKVRRGIVLSKAFWYIAAASAIIAFEGVLYKYTYEHGMSVGTAISGQLAWTLAFSLLFLLFKRARRSIREAWPAFKSNLHIFAAEESVTFAAVVLEEFAIKQAPVSIVKGLTLLTPFYVLFYAKAFKRFWPGWFKEDIDTGKVLKKIILFGLTISGILLLGLT